VTHRRKRRPSVSALLRVNAIRFYEKLGFLVLDMDCKVGHRCGGMVGNGSTLDWMRIKKRLQADQNPLPAKAAIG